MSSMNKPVGVMEPPSSQLIRATQHNQMIVKLDLIDYIGELISFN